MAQPQQTLEQPATESSQDLEALLEAKFGGYEERVNGEQQQEQPQTQEPEAQTGDEAEAQAESTESEFVEIEVDGETWHVPPKLKDRFMAQADYTAKTTEIATTRRNVEQQMKELALFQEQRTFEQSVAQDADRLKMIDAYISHEKSSTNWAALTTDQIVRKKMEIDQLADQRNELAQALDAKRNEFGQKIAAERSKLKQTAKETLAKAIPGWSDEVQGQIEKYAVSLGYPEAAVQHMNALDSQIAWESMQYRKLKAETKNAVKKAGEAPVIAPQARKNSMPKQVRAKLDLKNAVKSGNREKIAASVDARLSQLFGG